MELERHRVYRKDILPLLVGWIQCLSPPNLFQYGHFTNRGTDLFINQLYTVVNKNTTTDIPSWKIVLNHWLRKDKEFIWLERGRDSEIPKDEGTGSHSGRGWGWSLRLHPEIPCSPRVNKKKVSMEGHRDNLEIISRTFWLWLGYSVNNTPESV